MRKNIIYPKKEISEDVDTVDTKGMVFGTRLLKH